MQVLVVFPNDSRVVLQGQGVMMYLPRRPKIRKVHNNRPKNFVMFLFLSFFFFFTLEISDKEV